MKVTEDLRRMVALSLFEGMGPMGFKSLLEAAGSLEAIFERNRRFDDKAHWAKTDDEIQTATKAGVKIVPYFDPSYPESLKEIYAPPMLLYVKGVLPAADRVKIGVVGSRICSLYGRKMAEQISRELALSGVVVVSGMAIGIDGAAHEGALAGGGVTLAVLGSGLSNIYPPENKKMAEKITEKGALISEFPMKMMPLPQHFPMRNRIISGLSQGVLVVEAKEKSGALITADMALEQGREVFAVPGNADSLRSNGTNSLLKQGAKLVTSAGDILEELKLRLQVLPAGSGQAQATFSDEENRILSVLTEESIAIDEIIERSQLPAQTAIALLSTLQIKGAVKQMPGQYFMKRFK